MKIEEGLLALREEVELILKSELAPMRRQFYAGARHYLLALQELSDESAAPIRAKRKRKAAETEENENDKGEK